MSYIFCMTLFQIFWPLSLGSRPLSSTTAVKDRKRPLQVHIKALNTIIMIWLGTPACLSFCLSTNSSFHPEDICLSSVTSPLHSFTAYAQWVSSAFLSLPTSPLFFSAMDLPSYTLSLSQTLVASLPLNICLPHTDKKENQICLIYKEIQNGAVAKSYMTNGLLIYGEIVAHFLLYFRKPFLIYDCSTLNFPIYEENFIFFFYQCILSNSQLNFLFFSFLPALSLKILTSSSFFTVLFSLFFLLVLLPYYNPFASPPVLF